MPKHPVLALLFCAVALPVAAQSDPSITAPATAPATSSVPALPATPPSSDAPALLDTVVIPGQRPGPGLWKVSKNDHVLWILGTQNPLPKELIWRSREAENRLAESQELLGPPGYGYGLRVTGPISFLKGLVMAPQIRGASKNPGGLSLQDVLPPELYARWLPLKQKYLAKDNNVELDRPIFAAERLFETALDQGGLTRSDTVSIVVNKLAKKAGLKLTVTQVFYEVEQMGEAIRNFKKSPMADQECFAKTLARLESDLDAMRARANAWAVGDIGKIEQLQFTDQGLACGNAMDSNEAVKARPAIAALPRQARARWVAAAENALATNRSTFALMPMPMLLDPKGYLSDLTAKGYTVEKPD